MKRRTVLFLHPHFLKPGGASKVVLEQAVRLQKMGFYCPIITTKINSRVTAPYSSLDIYPLSRYSTGQLLFWLSFPGFITKLIINTKRINPEIIFCHSLAIYWGYIYKLFNPKAVIIYYLHDLGLPYTDLRIEIRSLPAAARWAVFIAAPILKIFNNSIFRAADYIVANSRVSADYLEKTYHRKADEISSPGVDIKTFKPAGKKQDYFYTLGRLEKSKNIDLIIKAFSDYINAHPSAQTVLKIIGEGVELHQLKAITKELGMEKRVIFLGRRESPDVAKIASQAQMGIFMGPYETYGMAAAECICCGTPIVGINTNGVEEIIKLTAGGISVEPDSLLAARAMDKLSDRHKKICENAGRTLSWDIQINKLAYFLSRI